MNLLDGKLVSQKIKDEIKIEVDSLKQKGIHPCLTVVKVGEDPASTVYIKQKVKACEYVGIQSIEICLPKETSQMELLNKIDELNNMKSVHGILVQFPLPKHISEKEIAKAISIDKDVDCFNPYNIGLLYNNNSTIKPCTPAGIIEILKHYNIEITGKNVVVIGRSDIVGKPMSQLLLNENATVTICHSKTQNLAKHTLEADIIVCAIGKPNFLGAHYIKEGAVVIDVGINRNEEGKLCGDVDFNSAKYVASYITPVPGGVGPLTVAMLLKNTVELAKIRG